MDAEKLFLDLRDMFKQYERILKLECTNYSEADLSHMTQDCKDRILVRLRQLKEVV